MENTTFTHSKVDSYGFEYSDGTDFTSYDEFMASYLRVLAHRASLWKQVMERNGVNKSRQLKRYCRKGVPNEYRAEVWMEVSGAAARMSQQPGLYKELLSQPFENASVQECIEKDIPRTFPENIHFADVRHDPDGLRIPLSHVLSAVAKHNPNTGYCQGMNFVAGLLLLVVKNEEKVFWLLDTLINRVVPDFYEPNMTALKAEQQLLGEIVRWKVPAVYHHMEALGVQWCLVGMKWFICMYADVLPIETVYRIWDCLFYEGSKILHRVALTLITMNEEKILACKSFTEAVDLFRVLVYDQQVVDCHSFMKNIFAHTGSFPRKKINRMREECVLTVE